MTEYHDIKLNKEICDKLIEHVESSVQESKISQDKTIFDGWRGQNSESKNRISLHTEFRQKVVVPKGTHDILQKEPNFLTKLNMKAFTENREEIILEKYKNYQESEYTKYSSPRITELIPEEIFKYFKISRDECSIYIQKLKPGKILVAHKDYYITFKYEKNEHKNLNINSNKINDKIIRVWISLSGKKFGHILIVENKAFYWQEQGTILTWNTDELHTAANLGYEDRYILIITGKVKNKYIFDKTKNMQKG